MRTNDLVLISLVEAMLKDDNVRYFVADAYMSALEGSVGFLPRRLMTHADDTWRARRLMTDAGFGHELSPEKARG